MLPRYESIDLRADHRCAPQTAAYQHAEADLALFIAYRLQADVMHRDGSSVIDGTRDGELELARQIAKLGMKGTPLTQYLGVRARIDDLVLRHAGELVAGDITYAVTRSLVGMHLHRRQVG